MSLTRRAFIATAPAVVLPTPGEGQPVISSIAELVEALGGREALAGDCMVRAETVAAWERAGLVPTGWHHRFALKAKRLGYTLADDLFGIVT